MAPPRTIPTALAVRKAFFALALLCFFSLIHAASQNTISILFAWFKTQMACTLGTICHQLASYSITKRVFRDLFHFYILPQYFFQFQTMWARRIGSHHMLPSSSRQKLIPPRPPHRFRKSVSMRLPISKALPLSAPTHSSRYWLSLYFV